MSEVELIALTDAIVTAAKLLGAGICMGVGAIGPGIGEGYAAGRACDGISRRPEEAPLLTRTMLVGQAVSETTGIYSLVVAIILIFVV
jgi:F-type H+-transporting ATPase subunit c